MHGKLIKVQCCTIGTKKIVGMNTSIILNKAKEKKNAPLSDWTKPSLEMRLNDKKKKKTLLIESWHKAQLCQNLLILHHLENRPFMPP